MPGSGPLEIKHQIHPKGALMKVRNVIAGAASAVVLLSQTALAGSLAPVVDCNVTPNAEECAVVTVAPRSSSSLAPGGAGGAGLAGLGTLGTVAAVGGVIAAAAIIGAIANNNDDDSSDTTTASQ